MNPRNCQPRRLLHQALVVQLLVALGHCAGESHHGLAAGAAAAAYQGTSAALPLTDSHSCENESGCICRGATQARPADLSHLANEQQVQWLADTLSVAAFARPVSAGPWHFAAANRAPPLSGRQLRALFASLVI